MIVLYIWLGIVGFFVMWFVARVYLRGGPKKFYAKRPIIKYKSKTTISIVTFVFGDMRHYTFVLDILLVFHVTGVLTPVTTLLFLDQVIYQRNWS